MCYAFVEFENASSTLEEVSTSKDVAVFRSRQSSDVLFGALVDALGRAELYGTTDQSIDLDLGLYELISILEASTPYFLSVQDPFSLLLFIDILFHAMLVQRSF